MNLACAFREAGVVSTSRGTSPVMPNALAKKAKPRAMSFSDTASMSKDVPSLRVTIIIYALNFALRQVAELGIFASKLATALVAAPFACAASGPIAAIAPLATQLPNSLA